MAEADRPSVIVLRSHIGWPSPKFTDTAKAHGEAFGEDEIREVKEILGLAPDEHFVVPDDVLDVYREAGTRGRARARGVGDSGAPHCASGARASPTTTPRASTGGASRAGRASSRAGPRATRIATRQACSTTLDAIIDVVPGLVGGGADLTGNTGTKLLSGAGVIGTHDFRGRQIHFGVREHGMGAVMNGMSSSGLLPFGGTFFVFSDYMRGAVRVAALSGYKVAFVWSHDSIGVGEDGPTHQPVEQLAAMRAMPGIRVIRPADANETAEAWRIHLDGDGPDRDDPHPSEAAGARGHRGAGPRGVAGGAYVLVDEAGDDPDIVLVGTGSEVQLCVDAARGAGRQRGVGARRVDAVLGALRGPVRRRAGRGAPARRAHARGRGRDELRLGALRRRHDRDRPLRRLRPRGRRPCASSGSPRTTSLARAEALLALEEDE